MLSTTTPEQLRAAKAHNDALMALSQIAFSSVERLTALNLNVARAALEDGLAASNSLLQIKDVNELKQLQNPFIRPATEKATAYFRGVQEIAAESQAQITRVLNSYFAMLGMGAAANAGWSAGFDMLDKIARQTNNMVEANIKTVGDTTAKMAASVSPHPRKAA